MNHTLNPIQELSLEDTQAVSGGQFWKELLKVVVAVEAILGLLEDTQKVVSVQ